VIGRIVAAAKCGFLSIWAKKKAKTRFGLGGRAGVAQQSGALHRSGKSPNGVSR
jgi:hypothetical protein